MNVNIVQCIDKIKLLYSVFNKCVQRKYICSLFISIFMYCKCGYFHWEKISWKCLQELSHWGNCHDTSLFSVIKSYEFFFYVGGIFCKKKQYWKKCQNYPHPKISMFTVHNCANLKLTIIIVPFSPVFLLEYRCIISCCCLFQLHVVRKKCSLTIMD